jgi:hypothetical protein
MGILGSPGRVVAIGGGQALRALTRVAALRPATKPLHPRGSVVSAVLHRFGSHQPSGAGWLDERGEDQVLVRQSRAVGLPAPAPDVFGLALRVPTRGGTYGDLLFASTGRGRLTRFVLTTGRSPHSRPMSTLLPYRTPTGPVVLSAVYRDQTTVDLSWAVGTGGWTRFAQLRLGQLPTAVSDAPVAFDPVLNTLPGLDNYGWVERLREPSYLTARRSRSTSSSRARS